MNTLTASIILILIFVVIGISLMVNLYKEIKKIDLSKPHDNYD